MANPKKNILIVEDNTAILDIYKKLCEVKFDAKVFAADNGETALKIINTEKLDLILCDLMLPTISGFDIISYLKSDEKFKDIPIIIVSAVADKGHVKLSIIKGANDFLVKPVPLKIMEEKIANFLVR
ncbi:MAG: hypothetical protein DKM50_05785 [Candidatus Margulisiibacteriota bacterium]|nr:MAG: hypothetical protein A2X43_12995 [Candidatus Margulisbacteria bacterium GWD2_39_127]PZM80058.1 MAG: hypothetical protein DKM50_05785 [Candidatus Margulisiibacteriota bacterium]HAR62871.1 hypothetical protein [Candidatus Margulisiibacteriota bacterium]HCT86382.1 hypothetical protein [Candidatus Margulisiibacteriota bacterium]HCY37773.1 hypothetical protein [Candidatus Margulisiibacteriota bacterium]